MAERAQLVPQYDSEGRAQFVRQYFDDSVETTASADDFDSAIGTAAVTDEFTSTPTITITPYDPNEVTGWLNVYIRVSGVDGKTPDFALSFADFRAQNDVPQNSEWGMVWRYVDDTTVPAGGRPRAWSTFDNNAGNVSHTFSNSSAFTSDDIEIAIKPRWRYLDTQRAVAYVESSGMAVELASSVAASGLPTHVHDQFTHSGTTANTAAATAINMYAVGVDDTSVSPSGGEDKLNFVLIPGQHASEDQGNDSCWETVLFYLDGTGTIADWFRQHCRLFVYDANPQGRYYGRERWTDETASDEDPNRAWDDSGSEQINAVKTAIGADLSRTDVLWDFHGAYSLNGNGRSYEYGIYATYATEALWRDRVNTLISPLVVGDMGTAPAGSAQAYGNDVLSAQLSSTLEFPIAPPGFPDPETSYQSLLSDYIEAVKDMVAADELTLSSTTYTLTATKGSYSTTGYAASILASRLLSAEYGTYTTTGYSADLLAGRVLTANKGAYSTTGYDTDLLVSRVLAAANGSYIVTGKDASLLASRLLTADKGSYVVTGYSATLTYTPSVGPDYTLTADKGSYSTTGYDVNLSASRLLTAAKGSYTTTGYDAGLYMRFLLTAENGSYAITGNDASLIAARKIQLETGSYSVTGYDVSITTSVTPTVEGMEYTLDGSQLHYCITGSQLNYTLGSGRIHYSMPDED